MAGIDRSNGFTSGGEIENHFVEEFRDRPTTADSPIICYFDTMLWVAAYLSAKECLSPDDPDKCEEEAERCIRRLCEGNKLQAWGHRVADGIVGFQPMKLPAEDWPFLYINVIDGQPAYDRKQHGGREYGEARWLDPELDPEDEEIPRSDRLAWTAIHFRKSEVLKKWPDAQRRISKCFMEATAKRVLTSFLKQNPLTTRLDANNHIESAGHKVSKHTFQKLWRASRIAAGLPPMPRGGRPKKSVPPTGQALRRLPRK